VALTLAALAGVTIVDLTRLLPGAVATLILRRAGATVIKVEQPPRGDYARALMPRVFELTNSGKKSVALDIRRSPETFRRLVASADVIVESFRPGVMERLGFGYRALREFHPRLIYAALRGYPDGDATAGHDINYMAAAGALDPPHLPPAPVADIAGGSLPLVIRILLALLERHHTGRGSCVEVSMVRDLDPLLVLPRALGRENPLTGRFPCYNLYQCADGRWIAVGALEEKFWIRLCQAIGREDLTRRQFDESAVAECRAWFASRAAGDWLEHRDCCVSLVAEPAPPQGDGLPAPALGADNGMLGPEFDSNPQV